MNNKRIASLLRSAIDSTKNGSMMPFSEKEYEEMYDFVKKLEQNKLISYEDVHNDLKYYSENKWTSVDIFRSFYWKYNK
jgi:thiamine kinase-like enzyme